MTISEQSRQSLCHEVMLGCACQGVRRTARALTQLYEHALAPIGLKATQFPILVALEAAGPVPLTPLAEALGMDRTTLTRNLKALEERGLVGTQEASDRRIRILELTHHGREVLDEALEIWQVSQASVKEAFGAVRLDELLAELSALTGSVRP